MKPTSILLLLAALPLAHANLNSHQQIGKPAPIELATMPIAMNRRPLALSVPIDGSVWRGTRFLAEAGDASKALRSTLSDIARKMTKESCENLFPGIRDGTIGKRIGYLPDEALVIRADENAPFDTIATILGQCMLRDVQIVKVEFEVAQEDSEQEGAMDTLVPIEVLAKRMGIPLETEVRTADVELSVSVAGSKRQPQDLTQAWEGKPGTRFAYDPEERELQYAFKKWKTTDVKRAVTYSGKLGARFENARLRIVVAPGVTVGEVLRFWERAGQDIRITFAASEE